jgi:hypothetical protein
MPELNLTMVCRLAWERQWEGKGGSLFNSDYLVAAAEAAWE